MTLQPYARRRYAAVVANIEKRGSYTPRRVRERRAFQLVVASGVAGTIGVVGLVLAAVGAVGAGWPIIALIVAAICLLMFRRQVGS
jgi:amino acid transporter